MAQELRLYTFTNFYLSSIQQGIQSGHAAVELFVKYQIQKGWKNGEAQMLNDWALNHKTMICLNGGDLSGVQEVMYFLDNAVENQYPWAPFYESDVALGGIPTSVAVILPERIFSVASSIRVPNPKVQIYRDTAMRETRITLPAKSAIEAPITYTYNEWEYELMMRLNSYSLAR